MTKKKPETLADTTVQVRNSNRHTQRGMGLLEKSISERGWIGAITTAANGETFDGSARRETLETAGLEDAVIVRTNGRQPIIHIREDIPTADDPRAIQLSIEANWIAAKNLDFDPAVLAGLAEDGVDLTGLFYADELAGILEDAGSELLASAPNLDPGDGRYKEQYGVIVICENEGEQEQAYNKLKDLGYTCRIVVT